MAERASFADGVIQQRWAIVPPKLLDQKSARRLLEQHGWRATRGGKHVVKMEKEGKRPITLPHHGGKTYGKGLTAAILQQAGLD